MKNPQTDYNPSRCEGQDKRIEDLEHLVNGNGREGLFIRVDRLEAKMNLIEKANDNRSKIWLAILIGTYTQLLAFGFLIVRHFIGVG